MNIEEYAESSIQYYNIDIPKILKEVLLKNQWQTFLDCGCGDGALLYAMHKAGIVKHKKIQAIDLSQNRIELVRKISPDIITYVDSAEELKMIDGDSIDVLVSMQVIEHVDDVKMINNIERVVKRNGLIYLTTVFKRKNAWYFYKNSQGERVLDPTHIREYFSDEELLAKFDPSIFEVLVNKKSILSFSLFGKLFKLLKINNRKIMSSPFCRFLSGLKIPIIGYYHWELVLRKK